ncbi:MAG: hypothetical protein KJO54_06185 [Gammaproteobacteria bacterium]|nr:hypothetical protein [Gammaproteobacteria bacterium]NNF61222.1 hypothetical protein [Gammaproteobacteria bacterium]NNM20808.1 hypothetical protein [Gammaproteobacteria bacterium]
MKILIAIVALGLAAGAAAEEVLVEFSGSGNKLTEEFEVTGPWLLDWSITTDYASEAGIEINLLDAVFLGHQGMVLRTRYAGAGTKLFRETGRMRFRVISTAVNWRLKVSAITDEEADAMIPVER